MKKAAKVSFKSITILVKEKLAKDPEIKYAAIKAQVVKFFPESKFNERHFSWYKSAFKRGVLKGSRQ